MLLSGLRSREGGVCHRITVSASEVLSVKEGERSASSRTLRGVMGNSEVCIRVNEGRLPTWSVSLDPDNASECQLTMHALNV